MQTYRYFLNRNKNGNGFSELLNGKIFVDKTGLIEEINEKISTKEKLQNKHIKKILPHTNAIFKKNLKT